MSSNHILEVGRHCRKEIVVDVGEVGEVGRLCHYSIKILGMNDKSNIEA